MISLLIVAAVALASSPTARAKNLADCACYPYDGDVTDYVCDDTSLTSIPDCVPIDILQINIRTPSIPLVPETIRRFTNLTRVNVAYFDNPEITKHFYSGHKNLTVIEIYLTALDYIDNDWFNYTPYIRELTLSHSKIPSLDSQIFSNMLLLEMVSLNSNQLTTVPPNLFTEQPLRELYIDDNPWRCDCDVATFMQWTRDHGVTVSDKAFCSYPLDLKGMNLKDLTPDVAC